MQITVSNGLAHYAPAESKPFSLPTTATTPADAVRQHFDHPRIRLLTQADAQALTRIIAQQPASPTTARHIHFAFSEPHAPEAPISPFLAAVTVTARAESGPVTGFTLIYDPAPTAATAARFIEAAAQSFEPNPFLYALNQNLPTYTPDHARAAYRAHTTARRISRFVETITQQERDHLAALAAPIL